jgi:hypothetical protein
MKAASILNLSLHREDGMKRYFLLSITILAVLASPCAAVEIEPSRIELDIPPGQVSSTYIKVTNWQDYMVKVAVKPDTYRYIFTDNAMPPPGSDGQLPSCQGWLTFEPNEFELSPNASMYIKCTIKVPSAAHEEHVAAVLFDEEGLLNTYKQHPSQPGNITLEIVPRFTIPLYITIRGKTHPGAEITDMRVGEGPRIGTIETDITVHNTGSVHLRPSGTLIFTDSQEGIIKTLRIGECLPIFPRYKEIIPVYFADMLEPGRYTAICTLDIGDGRLVQKKAVFRVTEDYDVE